jgi:ethanolamine permease
VQDPNFSKGVLWVAVWFAVAILYFAFVGRHKLILSPEEEFAIAHAAGGIDPGSEEPAPAE